jgi:hypothetical protein
VNGIFNTGNSVFKLQIPTIGPNITAIIINAMPINNLNSADVITKNPPKDKLTNNLLLACPQSKHSNLDL